MSKTVKIQAEIYSRVSGYYRPVNQWNKGKQEEFACRTSLIISDDAIQSCTEEAVGTTS